ncbi:unnamed protein product [Calypogeia fissa]
MADTIMVDGECTATPPLSPDAAGSPMQIHTIVDAVLGSGHFQGPLAILASLPCPPAGCSPGKYIPPRLRRSVSPASSPLPDYARGRWMSSPLQIGETIKSFASRLLLPI